MATPPPYSNISGTSAIIGKYNQQETISEADGNARPGQLIVNLASDPPELYIGNNAGNLSLVGGGGGGGTLPLANGTSNFDIAISGGNATITVAGTKVWTFDTTGVTVIPSSIIGLDTVSIDNRGTGNIADIQLYSADDILLQARARAAGSNLEGGDINIFAGNSAPDSVGAAPGTGGDVRIIAGYGGGGNVNSGGAGGAVDIWGGGGGAANTNSGGGVAGAGADLTLLAGDAGDNNGDIDLGNQGGNVVITAGDSSGNNFNGGNVVITGGGGGTNGFGGSVEIYAPSSTNGPGGTWVFDGAGIFSVSGPMKLAMFADALSRDAFITSPMPGMMVYITGTGMQVRGDTSWNTVAGSGT